MRPGVAGSRCRRSEAQVSASLSVSASAARAALPPWSIRLPVWKSYHAPGGRCTTRSLIPGSQTGAIRGTSRPGAVSLLGENWGEGWG